MKYTVKAKIIHGKVMFHLITKINSAFIYVPGLFIFHWEQMIQEPSGETAT